MTFIQICSRCRPPRGKKKPIVRIWEEVRCSRCRLFYCRKSDCLRPLTVNEHDVIVHCGGCGTVHHFSGLQAGKVCVDRPIHVLPILRAAPAS